MTEASVQYGPPPEPQAVSYDQLPPDARWLMYLNLGMEEMDSILARASEEWLAKFADHHEAGQELRLLEDAMRAIENEIIANPTLLERLTAKTKGEREEQRQAIIQSHAEWVLGSVALTEQTLVKDALEAEMEELQHRIGILKSRLAWRGRTVALLTSLPRMDVDRMPTEEMPPPVLDTRPQSEVQPDWPPVPGEPNYVGEDPQPEAQPSHRPGEEYPDFDDAENGSIEGQSAGEGGWVSL